MRPVSYLKELWSARELFKNLVLRETSGQYKRTVLGRLWSLATPLSQMVVYTFVFSFIFRVQPAAGDPSGLNVFAVWLLCGLLPWTFFSTALSSGANSVLSNASLVTKVYFPRTVLPLAAVGAAVVNWSFEMLVLAIALLVIGAQLWIWLPLALVIMVLLAVFAAGIGMLLAVANVYFRDTQYFLTIILQIWMYLTPIVYPVSLIADQSARVGGLFGTQVTLLDIYQLNPMYHFVQVMRQVLYDNRLPDGNSLLICAIWAFGALALGLFVFNRKQDRLAEAL